MKHSRKISILVTALTVACFTGSFGIMSMADSSNSYKSQGKIVFDNNTTATTDDIIFDATDFNKIDTMITEGKGKVATAINTYPNANVQSLDTFDNLASAIGNLTSVPDIYYYDKATEGDSCARYMYENGSYYPCDQNGKKTSSTALSGTITVVTKDDTTEPADGEIQLVKYEQTDAANLSAGYAGYADKSFILGSGSDNISYRNQVYISTWYAYGNTDGRSSATFRDLGDCNTLSFNKCETTTDGCGIRIYGMPTNESDFDSTKELIWSKNAAYTWKNKSFDITAYEKITVILIPGDSGTVTISGFRIE